MNVPSELKYTASHEWVKIEGDLATVGITDFAQSELGDVVFVDLPEVGRTVSADETIASVESVKAVSDIYAPVSGEVVAVNPALGARSELLNSDPYGEGWLFQIRMSDGPTSELIDADTYRAKTEE